jgi:hypothetical protein
LEQNVGGFGCGRPHLTRADAIELYEDDQVCDSAIIGVETGLDQRPTIGTDDRYDADGVSAGAGQ